MRSCFSGISLAESMDNSIFDNTVETNEMHGIDLSYSSSNYVYGNNATKNSFGIYLFFSPGNTLEDNRLYYFTSTLTRAYRLHPSSMRKYTTVDSSAGKIARPPASGIPPRKTPT